MHLYRLPVFSGILLALVFYPFYFWPLALVALVPLFCFAARATSYKQLLFGGFVVGFIGIGPLVLFSLAQLSLFPHALAFTYAVRFSSIPTILLVGCLFGAVVYLWRKYRPHSPWQSSLLGGALYVVLVEVVLQVVFGGYYYGSLAHASVSLYPARLLASLGGTFFVSGAVVFVSIFIAEALEAEEEKRKRVFLSGGVALVVLALLAGYAHVRLPTGSEKTLSVAVVQTAPERGAFPYAQLGEEELGVPEIEEAITEAAQRAELVIYPHTLVGGVVQEDSWAGEWLAGLAPSATVVVWNTVAAQGEELYDELVFWQEGEKSVYRKRKLYALSDYAPGWAQALGLEKNPFTLSPGQGSGQVQVGEVMTGGLICSELHQASLTSKTAREAAFLLAVGSDTMFPNDLSGNYSLAAARYRAAENGIAVVRANILGPSAIIDARGRLSASALYGVSQTLYGNVPLKAGGETVYAQLLKFLRKRG